MRVLSEREGGGEETFPPVPAGGWPAESIPDGSNVDGEELEEEEAKGLGVPFFGTDPQSWDSGALVPGAIIEFEVSEPTLADGTERKGLISAFVKEMETGAHGAWLRVRVLGGTTAWAMEWGTKTFSREKKRVHVCRFGLKHCKVGDERGHHIWEFMTFAPGIPPQAYVGKAKVRDWKKLYEEARGGSKEPRESPGGGAGDSAPDRVALLKSRLLKAREKGDREREAGAVEAQQRATEALRDLQESLEDRHHEDGGDVRSSSSRKRPATDEKKGVREALVTAATRVEAERHRTAAKRNQRRRSRSRRRRRSSRGRRTRSQSSRSRSTSSSSSSMVPPLQKKATKHPGSVLKMLATNVSEALAQAAVTDPGQPVALGCTANQMSSYYQIVARPMLGNKVRDCRELETLACCIDLLRNGKLPELGDALAGRFLAVESAGLTNNWADAQHLEVIPVRHHGLAPPSILLQAQKHTRQVEKAAGRRTWPRNNSGQPGWGAKGEPRQDRGAKDDGRGRGKGGKKGGNKGGKGAWKDKEKGEAAPEMGK